MSYRIKELAGNESVPTHAHMLLFTLRLMFLDLRDVDDDDVGGGVDALLLLVASRARQYSFS